VSKSEAFVKLCLYLEENEECHYSLSELLDIHQSFLNEGEERYSEKTLKEKLKNKYGDQVIITTIHALSNVVNFREKGHILFCKTCGSLNAICLCFEILKN